MTGLSNTTLLVVGADGVFSRSRKKVDLAKIPAGSVDAVVFFATPQLERVFATYLFMVRRVLKQKGSVCVFWRVEHGARSFSRPSLSKKLLKTLSKNGFEGSSAPAPENLQVFYKRPLQIYLDARGAEQGGGGLRKYVQKITECIAQNGDTPHLIATKQVSFSLPAGAQLHTIPVRFHTLVWEELQLLFFLLRVQPDIYHAPANTGVPLFFTKPSLLTIQDIIPLESADFFAHSKFPLLSRALFGIRSYSAYFRAQRVIVTTQQLGSKVTKVFGPKSAVAVVPIGVEDRYFHAQAKKHQPKEPYILSSGGVAERKNIGLLLQSFAEFSVAKPEYKLYITGENNQLVPTLKKLSQELGIEQKVTWLGWVSDSALEKLMRGASCSVYPSSAEGFGLPVLESLALGIPVVASVDLPVCTITQGVPFYCSESTKAALTHALLEATDSTDSARLEKGRLIAKKYLWSTVLHKLYHEYGRALQS